MLRGVSCLVCLASLLFGGYGYDTVTILRPVPPRVFTSATKALLTLDTASFDHSSALRAALEIALRKSFELTTKDPDLAIEIRVVHFTPAATNEFNRHELLPTNVPKDKSTICENRQRTVGYWTGTASITLQGKVSDLTAKQEFPVDLQIKIDDKTITTVDGVTLAPGAKQDCAPSANIFSKDAWVSKPYGNRPDLVATKEKLATRLIDLTADSVRNLFSKSDLPVTFRLATGKKETVAASRHLSGGSWENARNLLDAWKEEPHEKLYSLAIALEALAYDGVRKNPSSAGITAAAANFQRAMGLYDKFLSTKANEEVATEVARRLSATRADWDNLKRYFLWLENAPPPPPPPSDKTNGGSKSLDDKFRLSVEEELSLLGKNPSPADIESFIKGGIAGFSLNKEQAAEVVNQVLQNRKDYLANLALFKEKVTLYARDGALSPDDREKLKDWANRLHINPKDADAALTNSASQAAPLNP